jgi:hypothetical protein
MEMSDDYNPNTKGKEMGKFKKITNKILTKIVEFLITFNKFHNKHYPWSDIVALSIITLLVIVSKWLAAIILILVMFVRIAFLEKWLEKFLNPF